MKTFAQFLAEGINDPGILKCVFLAGGPGSGKSYIGDFLFGVDRRFKTSMSTYGLKVVNSDPLFELLLKKGGVNPKDLADIERNDPVKWAELTGPDSPRARAKSLSQHQLELYQGGKLGLIIDGTGDNVAKIERQKHQAENAGYDTMMVFVNTSLPTAMQRNRQRARTLPDALVKEIWQSAQDNLSKFSAIFDRFVVVNNDGDVPPNMDVQKAVRRFIAQPVRNPRGIEWMRVMKAPSSAYV